MTDSLLYAKLPPKLKRSVNMARLENGTYEEKVADLKRELDLNALEESDDLPMATMAPGSSNNSNLLSNGITANKDAQCSYCKATGHFHKTCLKFKKRNWMIKTAKSPSVKLTQNAQTAGKRTIPLNGAGKEQGHIYVRKGRTRTTSPMTPLERKRHPRRSVPQKQIL